MSQKEAVTSLPRPEYPRPDFSREATSWLNLNGQWEFAFDDTQSGITESWQHRQFEGSITVPFAFQSKLSGINDPSLHHYLWYARNFECPPEWAEGQKRFLLHFGAVDYQCQVWVNGQPIGEHQGGHIPFSFDVSEAVKPGETNRVVVYVEDTESKFQPRGKQYWKLNSEFCFYTRTSGIWQTVWLEAVPEIYLSHLQVNTDIDKEQMTFVVDTAGTTVAERPYWLHVKILFDGQVVAQEDFRATHQEDAHKLMFKSGFNLPGARLWSPETPHLYDLQLSLYSGNRLIDEVHSYFGMRKIATKDGKVWLNNQPYYLKLILDQGYFPDGLLTAPADEALRYDVEIAKQMGFNGARKHQKIEDPRWLYWADKLGLLVWGEMPSAYAWNEESEKPFTQEWLQAITRDYNHPCIMAWVPFNESWGIEQIASDPLQQQFVKHVVALTRYLDKTRLVIDNDGWEHPLETYDLLTIHDYTAQGQHLFERYEKFAATPHEENLPLVSNRPVLVPPNAYRGQPIILSEFGGISLIPPALLPEAKIEGDWGYSNASDSQHLIEQYRGLVEALARLGFTAGFCYTQLTDVEQEVNGFLTYDRRLKVDPNVVAKINDLLEFKPEISDTEKAVA